MARFDQVHGSLSSRCPGSPCPGVVSVQPCRLPTALAGRAGFVRGRTDSAGSSPANGLGVVDRCESSGRPRLPRRRRSAGCRSVHSHRSERRAFRCTHEQSQAIHDQIDHCRLRDSPAEGAERRVESKLRTTAPGATGIALPAHGTRWPYHTPAQKPGPQQPRCEYSARC